jgi:hypothetical protein
MRGRHSGHQHRGKERRERQELGPPAPGEATARGNKLGPPIPDEGTKREAAIIQGERTMRGRN